MRKLNKLRATLFTLGKIATSLFVILILLASLGYYVFLYNPGFDMRKFMALRIGMPCNRALEHLGEPLGSNSKGVSKNRTVLFTLKYDAFVGCNGNIIDYIALETWDDYTVYGCFKNNCPYIGRPEEVQQLLERY